MSKPVGGGLFFVLPGAGDDACSTTCERSSRSDISISSVSSVGNFSNVQRGNFKSQ